MRKPDPDHRDGLPEGLYLSSSGSWFHDGSRIRHERLCQLLHRCIQRGAQGELQVSTGRDTLPFVAEDAPYLVRTTREELGVILLVLSNGNEEPLKSDSKILMDSTGRIRVSVMEGQHWALLSRSATQSIVSRIKEDSEGDCYRIALGGNLQPRVLLCETQIDWSATPP